MSGFLRGWLRRETLETCCAWANACGAFAVSRLLCSPESPTFAELQHFLRRGSPHRALRHDRALNHIHHATTRRPAPETLRILSIDHGAHDLEPMVAKLGADPARIPAFKRLAVRACRQIADGRSGFGMFLDGDAGRQALFDAAAAGLWTARQFPHGSPQAFADNPREWPVTQVIKLIANGRSDARTPLAARLPEVRQVMAVAAAGRRETLIEALPAEGKPTVALLDELYGEDLKPDYWLVEAQGTATGWGQLHDLINRHDPHCRGMIAIARSALSGPELALAAAQAGVIGFVGGRSIFGDALTDWLSGALDDEAAVCAMVERFARLSAAFDDGLSRNRHGFSRSNA